MMRFAALIACLVLAMVSALAQDESEVVPTMSVNDLMVTVITPATDTLWGIEDPQTAGDWQVFIDAADIVIEAGRTMKAGGTGPNDGDWASNPEWQAFADAIIGAGRDARQAAIDRDIDAMYAAGEVLYPPCEDCHKQFNPGVAEQ